MEILTEWGEEALTRVVTNGAAALIFKNLLSFTRAEEMLSVSRRIENSAA